jgi:hypothetical protein
MKRNWVTLLVLAATALPAMAAKSVSIQQLEQMLFTDHSKSDEKVAERLSDLELTERVSPIRLAKWEKDFPGSRTREALMKLADQAAFLEPPQADVVRDPPPDTETQEKMLALALDYVRTTLGRLPNFYATRETMHFEDIPSQPVAYATGSGFGSGMRSIHVPGFAMGRTDARPLHSTGTSSETVTYRDGSEVNQAGKSKEPERQATGLTTNGEFGPILGVVLGDAMRSQVAWARWEQGTGDPVAVFRYAVPEDASHYRVGIPNGTKMDQFDPAYHGEFAIDPASGSVLRLSVVADMAPPHEMMRTAMLVEYSPVEIGGRTCNCPVHGVAFSKIPVGSAKIDTPGAAPEMQTQLNDVAFTHYHQFGSESRIVVGAGGAGAGNVPSATGTPSATGPPSATVPPAEPSPSAGAPSTPPASQGP